MDAGGVTPALDSAAFARLMARFDPFEPCPVVAVGVSGGADSLALALLAADWAAARGGRLVALTVDHGLRPASAEEARQVGRWLGDRAVAHHLLPWEGPKPGTGLQAAARAARHALLGDWCAANGVLHLLLAHHRGDQAETIALRREDGSGPDGLAGMAAEVATPWGRLLRPLLGEPKASLTASLAAMDQPWVEDPSNRDDRHARVRLRREIAATGAEEVLAEEARRHGESRRRRDAEVARALAGAVRASPEGWAAIAPEFIDLPDATAAAVLSRVLVTIGDLDYPPRGERLGRLLASLRRRMPARTLAGCRIVLGRDGWIVAREPAAMPAPEPFSRATTAWDRFSARLPVGIAPDGLWLGALGTERPPGSDAVPGPVRPGVPAVRDLDGAVAVPHFGWVRPGADPRLCEVSARLIPRQSLAQMRFAAA